jgi:hypothetical protein
MYKCFLIYRRNNFCQIILSIFCNLGIFEQSWDFCSKILGFSKIQSGTTAAALRILLISRMLQASNDLCQVGRRKNIRSVLSRPVRGQLFPSKTSEFPPIIPVSKQRKVALCAPSPSPPFIPPPPPPRSLGVWIKH